MTLDMTEIFDCTVPAELLSGMRLARSAIGRGELVVIPTDTVYGIAADAFNPAAVRALLAAKGRSRQSPPPVLVAGIATLDALAESVSEPVRLLTEAFWPGGLTVIVQARRSLAWDLGDTHGTVALRMPRDAIALDLLTEVGPLAVSSANLTGEPAATSAREARAGLGERISVYLAGGVTSSAVSSIVDASAYDGTPGSIRIVRHGVIDEARIRAVIGDDLASSEAGH
jgi:L-threonylcarbamoyladenylate synthase